MTPPNLFPPSSTLSASQAADDGIKEHDDGVDDTHEDCADAVDNGHEATADRVEAGLDLFGRDA